MTQSSQTTMRALLQPDKESTDLILTSFAIPKPNFERDEHLIKVYTVSPCNGELLWTKNFPPISKFPKELVPCDDVAGIVTEAPPSSPFQPGTRVYARTNYNRTGNARGYTIGLTDELAVIPERLSWAEAATVPLSALTAWQALFIQSGLGDFESGVLKGKRVLVTAASGGVGIWMVQLAKLAGAEVIGTCGPDNIEFVKSLGASEVLNYRSTDFKKWASEEGKKVDLVIDCIGRKSLEDAWWTVKEGGILISIFQPPEGMKPAEIDAEKIKNFMFIMVPDGKSLGKLSKLLEDGSLRPVLDSVYPLEKFEEAFERLASGHSRGKIVLELQV